MPAAVTDDREAAFATMRQDLITYWNLPFYRAMIERSGYGDDIAAFDAGQQAGDMEAAVAGISDDFLADADRDRLGRRRCVPGVERYAAAGAISPCVGPVAAHRLRGDARSRRPGG